MGFFVGGVGVRRLVRSVRFDRYIYISKDFVFEILTITTVNYI